MMLLSFIIIYVYENIIGRFIGDSYKYHNITDQFLSVSDV